MLINNTIESSRKPGIPGPHRPDLKWFKDALDGKSDVGHVHKKKDIEDFEHNHDGRYYRKDEHELQLLLSGNGTPNFNQGINGDYYVDELNGDLYKKSGDAWNLIIHLEGEQGAPGPQGNPGVPGPQGNPGKEGYTPVRGTDYWTPEDEEIIRQSIVSEVQLGLSNKVDKIEGKGLSTEDFTTLLKQKLEELQNYDDRDIRELLEKALYNVTIDVKTGILTFHTIDESTFTVDLPLELIVSDGYLNKDTNTIVLVLANDNTIDIPVENLIKDFYSKSEVDQKIGDLAEEVNAEFDKVDEELAKAQAQIDALKAENEAQQKELDILYNDLVPGEASGETAVVANGVTGSKVEIDGDGNTYQEVIEAVEGTTVVNKSIYLTDVNTTKESKLFPNGGISQDSREGYNVVDFSNPTLKSAKTTYTFDNDIATIENSGGSYQKVAFDVIDIFLKNAGQKLTYIRETVETTGETVYAAQIEYTVNTTKKYLYQTNNVFSIPEDLTGVTEAYFSVYVNNSNVAKVGSVTITKPMFIVGTESKPYEKYGAMPSLDFPNEVKGVSGHYDNVVENENIFKFGKITVENTAFNVEKLSENKIKINGTTTYDTRILAETCKKPIGKNMSLSVKKVSGTINGMVNLTIYKGNYSQATMASSITINSEKISTSLRETSLNEPQYQNGIWIKSGTVLTDLVLEFEMNYGMEPLYKFTTPQSQSLPLDIPFNMYSGKAYKKEGKWYRPIEYKKEFLSGKLNGKRATIDSSKSLITFNLDNAYRGSNYEIYTGFSNLLKGVSRDDIYNYLKEGIAFATTTNDYYGTGGVFYFEETSQMTLEEANAYITEKGMYVVYPLAVPEKEEITDTTLISQLEELQKAKSYYEVTNINSYSSGGADLVLSGKYYVSNKFRIENLEKAILSLGGNI